MDKKPLLYIFLLTALFIILPNLQARERNFTVVIDAGHGGKDPGAKGAIVNEKEINLAVALKVGKMIEDNHNNVKVIYTRKTDRFVELDERANIANDNKANLFISIHTNAVGKRNSSAKGTETYTLGLARNDENLAVAMRENSAILLEEDYKQRYEGFDPNSSESYIIFEFIQNKHVEQSISLASEVQKCFSSANRANRGVRQAGFLVLRKTSMPSILIELGYISNREEERYMKSENGRKQLATAIYNAFTKYKRDYDRRQGALSNNNGTAPLFQYAEQEVEADTYERTAEVINTTDFVPSSTKTPPPGSEADILARKQRRLAAQQAGEQPAENRQMNRNGQGKVIYKIQILTSPTKLSARSRLLRGYRNIDYFIEDNTYKYTYGESTSFNTINKLRRSILKDFKDAFIITFKDGKRIQ